MSDRKIPPLSRGIIHPADPPRDRRAVDIELAVTFQYTPPEGRAATNKCIAIFPAMWSESKYTTLDEFDAHIANLVEFLSEARRIEAEPHHAHEWGEPRPDFAEDLINAVWRSVGGEFPTINRDGARESVRRILEREVWQAET